MSFALPAGLCDQVSQTGEKLLGCRGLEPEANANARAERQELLLAQLVCQPAIAGEHDGEQRAGVEACAREESQLVEDDRRHLLRLVDEQHGAHEGGLEVLLPALAQRLGAGPAVVGAKRHTEEIAELAVEVGEIPLGARQGTDLDLRQPLEPLGEKPETTLLPARGSPVTRAKQPSLICAF